MATKKDLVEAYSFSRRRLVTAFLSGAPGGREVEPARPTRTIVGGLALAILLVAGAAIASVLASRTDEDWNQIGLVVSQQTSAQYVILKEAKHPTLIPVANVTSAQLILGSTLKPTYVDQSVIENQTPGTLIGIFSAPQLLPQPSQFIEQGWTSCTDAGLGMTLNISRSQHVAAQPGRGAVVKTVDPSGRSDYYLIAESSDREGEDRRAYAYSMPHAGRLDQALRDVGLDAEANAVQVPTSFVGLFPAGGPLTAESFPIKDFGQAPPADVAKYLPAGATIGQFYESGDQSLVVTANGSVELDPFSLAVYKETVWGAGKGKKRLSPMPLAAAPDPSLQGAKQFLDDAHWPDTTLDPVSGQVCAQLDLHADQTPKVFLRSNPSLVVAASENSNTDDPPDFSIDRGQGAYVMIGDWDDSTSTSSAVIDPRGSLYTLIGSDTTSKLGYDEVSPPLVPASWTGLFSPGVALSTNAALCPPSLSDTPGGASADASAAPSASGTEDSTDEGTQEGAAPDCQVAPEQ